MYLVHACIEGPENCVFYRGRSETVNLEPSGYKVKIPTYVKSLVDKNSVTIQLTCIETLAMICVSLVDIPNDCFYVKSSSFTKFYWELKATRRDIPNLNAQVWKNSVNVKGDGPYRYFSTN